MSYHPSHSRSKSCSYSSASAHFNEPRSPIATGNAGIPPPPTDADSFPVDYQSIPASPLYRKHSRRKSSQILIEPIGNRPKSTFHYTTNSGPTPVPPALENIFNQRSLNDIIEEGRAKARATASRFQFPMAAAPPPPMPRSYTTSLKSPTTAAASIPFSPTGYAAETGQYDLPADLSIDTLSFKHRHQPSHGSHSSSSNSSKNSPRTPRDLGEAPGLAVRSLYAHARSHTISHEVYVPDLTVKAASAAGAAAASLAGIKNSGSPLISPNLYTAESNLFDRRNRVLMTRQGKDGDMLVSGRHGLRSLSIDTKPRDPVGDADRLIAPPPTANLIHFPEKHAGKLDSKGEAAAVYVYSASMLATGAGFLIAAQFVAQLVRVLLAHLIQRFVKPDVVATNARLELLITTILYLSREGIRLATQRQTIVGQRPDAYRFEGGVVENTLSGMIQMIVNLGFVPLVVGVPLAGVLSYLFLALNSSQTGGGAHDPSTSAVTLAVIIFAVSAVIELAAEPSFLLAQLRLHFKKRAVYETVAVLTRCVLTFLFITLGRRKDAAIIAFALGQLGQSLVLATLYIYNGLKYAQMNQFELTHPQGVWVEGGNTNQKVYLDKATKKLAVCIWLHTGFKLMLAESDKVLVSLLVSGGDQGVYAAVVSYGLAVARLVFYPIEDVLRNFYSKLLVSPVNRRHGQRSMTILTTLIRFDMYLCLLALVFGPMVSPYLVHVFASGAPWVAQIGTSPVVLATYACYIPFLAVTGCLESFVQSVATPADIKRQCGALLASSVTFSAAAYLLMHPLNLGAQGLVLANMFNMAQRIGWCVMWIEAYYSKLRGPMPRTHQETSAEPLDTLGDLLAKKASAATAQSESCTTPAIESKSEDAEATEKRSNSSTSDAAIPDDDKEFKLTAAQLTAEYYDHRWGWLLLAAPRPVVFAVAACLGPLAWLFLGPATTFHGLVRHSLAASVLLLTMGVCELALIRKMLPPVKSWVVQLLPPKKKAPTISSSDGVDADSEKKTK